MSEEENKNQIQIQGELSQEEVAKLINKTLQEGKPEAEYILTLTEWQRPGQSFEDNATAKVLYGKVEKVLLRHEYNYPTTNEYTYAIIPKSRSAIILFEWGNDYEGEMITHQRVYVFDYEHGWRSLNLY